MSTIKVASEVQKTLLEVELKGQMSDGHWENSTPHNHWKEPCRATVVVDSTKQGIDFYSRKYNFNNSMLVEIVGARMVLFARARIKYPNVTNEAILALDTSSWIWDKESGTRYRELLTEFGITSRETHIALLAELDHVPYSMKDLRKDLRALSVTFRSAL